MKRPSFWQSFIDNDYFIWFIALSLSLAIHLAVLLKTGNSEAAPSNIIKETITHVRFATLAPPPPRVVEPIVEQPRPEPVIPPEPVISKQPEPEPEKKPRKKQKPKKKPEKPKKIKPKKAPLKKQPVKRPTKQRTPQKKQKPVQRIKNSQNIKPLKNQTVSASPVIAKADPRLIEQTRTSYLTLLMRHIEVYKHYPRVARKRKIEGDILVSFTLLPGGKIKNLRVIGKRSILEKASKEAVNHALPLPVPPEELSLPMQIKFNMNYFLR